MMMSRRERDTGIVPVVDILGARQIVMAGEEWRQETSELYDTMKSEANINRTNCLKSWWAS